MTSDINLEKMIFLSFQIQTTVEYPTHNCLELNLPF